MSLPGRENAKIKHTQSGVGAVQSTVGATQPATEYCGSHTESRLARLAHEIEQTQPNAGLEGDECC